jgi:hypothetical protein
MEDPAKQIALGLTSLEIFFISTTLLSIFFNLYQFMVGRKEKRALHAPLTNTLIGLFNDIKSKGLTAFNTQQLLLAPQNPHRELDTLKWEYFHFIQSVIGYLSGFQEALVGALVTLNPEDKEGKLSFRASDYGLTEDEKEQRKQYMKRWAQAQEVGTSSQTENPAPKHADSESVD